MSLVLLLDDASLRAGFLAGLSTQVGVDLSSVTGFRAEVLQGDGGRSDVEGHDRDGRPVLVIEAKFGADLGAGQLRSYLVDQRARLGSAVEAVFVVLVPRSRVVEAQRVLDAARNVAGDIGPTSAAVVTWNDCIAHLESTVASLASGDVDQAGALGSDVAQFRAMCDTLGGLLIRPLGLSALGVAWRDRADDLRSIAVETSGRFVPPDIRFPVGDETGYLYRRYMPGGDAHPDVCCSLGVATMFADRGDAVFWLRYHRLTPGFEIVSRRLQATDWVRTERANRHLWVPLHADPDMAGPELVNDLTEQITRVIAAASSS